MACYAESFDPVALDFVGVAVEKFGTAGGAEAEASFKGLLSHLAQVTCARVQAKGMASSTELVAGFFGMAQRFLLFCPRALVTCDSFPLIYEFAVACLSQCGGERDSTRSSLTFLTQIIGRRSVRLSPETAKIIEEHRDTIDAQTARHGSDVVKAAFESLAGGTTQMLVMPFTDCLYAVVAHLLGADADYGSAPGGLPSSPPTNVAFSGASSPPPAANGPGAALVQSWIVGALNSGHIPPHVTPTDKSTVLAAVLRVAGAGQKEKGTFKKLMGDFEKVCRKESPRDTLNGYA